MSNKIIKYRINESPVLPGRVLILNTLPLTNERFVKGTRRHFFSFSKHRCDFLKTQFPAGIVWDTYCSQLVYPILAVLHDIKKNTKVCIDYDVRFADFSKATLSDQFDVIFLVAHHIEENDSIEFFDGGVPISVVFRLLDTGLVKSGTSINFIICNSSEFSKLKNKERSYSGIVSVGFWEFPVLESYNFINHWVQKMDGKRSLSGSYGIAIDCYKRNIDFNYE